MLYLIGCADGKGGGDYHPQYAEQSVYAEDDFYCLAECLLQVFTKQECECDDV